MKSLKEDAYDRIYTDILTLELKPGQYLSENFLQKEYNISRSPARTVLVQLEHEKLLQNMGRKGHMISPVTIQDIRNVFQLRIFLEPPAAKLAAGRVDTEKLAELDSIFSAAVKDHSSGKKPFLAVHKANKDFHLEIVKAVGNNQLVDMLKKLVEIDHRIHHLMATSSPDLEHWSWDHKEIRNALINKNGAAAEKKVRKHIEESHDKVMSYIMNLPSITNTNISG
ncbi:MAG: GntR family transcriptional regulator [Thermodesulfobacteriota bacterium]